MTEKKTTHNPDNRYRVSLKKSNRYITAQIIDDSKGVTIAAVSPQDTKEAKTKTAQAELAGQILGNKATDSGIKKVYLDRGSNRYHGRVQIFTDSLRKSGLEL